MLQGGAEIVPERRDVRCDVQAQEKGSAETAEVAPEMADTDQLIDHAGVFGNHVGCVAEIAIGLVQLALGFAHRSQQPQGVDSSRRFGKRREAESTRLRQGSTFEKACGHGQVDCHRPGLERRRASCRLSAVSETAARPQP